MTALRSSNGTASTKAIFDNDGTLWCEKPMPIIELGFILQRFVAMAEEDESLRAAAATSCG